MEIILPKNQNAVHPAKIFKDAWGICWKNLGKLGLIYLIFNLPISLISLSPAGSVLQSEKLTFLTVLWYAIMFAAGSWGHIALVLGANKAAQGEENLVLPSIVQARSSFLRYVGVILSVCLFVLGLMVSTGLLIAAVLIFVPAASKLLATILSGVLAVALLCFMVYFLLRWSFAALVCILENKKPLESLNISLELVKKHINPLVGLFCLMGLTYLCCLLPMIAAEIISGRSIDPATQNPPLGVTLYVGLLNVAMVPVWTTVSVLFYKRLKEVH